MEDFRSQLQNYLQGIKNDQKQIRLQSLKTLIQNVLSIVSTDEKVPQFFEWISSSNFRATLLEVAFTDAVDSCREVALQSIIK